MLNRLRIQLTATFLLATFALVVLIGGGSYYFLWRYFKNTIDLSLQHRMASQFQLFGVELPPSLLEAERTWFETQTNLAANQAIPLNPNDPDYEDLFEQEREAEYETERGEHAYESDLSAVFVFPLDASGQLLFDPNPYPVPLEPDVESGLAALETGFDWHTVTLDDGTRVRLLSYRTADPGAPAVLQLGRLLTDQDRVLRQLLVGIIIVGGFSFLLVGGGSWQLAGRTLGPAQKAWDQQQAFIANASHELRTPLTLIRASTEVALRHTPVEKEAGLLRDVLDECDYMDDLVEDLLLLSRLDAGHLELQREEVALENLLGDIERQIRPLAEQRGIQVSCQAGDVQVYGDRTRLRQVLLILLDNAIQHTPSGGAIRLEVLPGNKQVQIVIADNGSGIPAEHLLHLFERFYQVKSEWDEGTRSNGLGLSIAKRLIEAHAGSIQVDSREGEGTRVTITLSKDTA
ncbi:MAG: HAMP domain-containing histidine kinase [Anaerolineales bacterium]|nr:HAMP domain-containing histidine kinase [Anaerolineales bacterium]